MAQKQVAARTEGDVFQGMFFWLQAALLLRRSSRVGRVAIEYDAAAEVDDVVVFYDEPGVNAGAHNCLADFYQVKYHVDRSSQYCAGSICDPSFIRATRSLLQRFHDAHTKLREKNQWYRLHLISNWTWSPEDPIAPLLREAESGALPERFFSDGPGSGLGKIRREWREHLELSEPDFDDFARRLRLGVDYLGRRGLREMLSERLRNVGLIAIAEEKAQNIYDSLAQQFVMNGTNEFDAVSFRTMCEKEGLLAPVTSSGHPVLGIRSFMRFAERMEDECDRFVCVSQNFEGRHINDGGLWQSPVTSDVQTFLAEPSVRLEEHHLLLECHSSLAFLAGYELDRKSGAQVFPVQKGVRTSLWKPSETAQPNGASGDWSASTLDLATSGADVALAASLTRDVLDDVRAFVEQSASFASIVDARPVSGVGPRSVADADHAVALADGLAEIIRKNRPLDGGTLHLFIAAPNAVMFFLGQHRGALGKVQLYEFDFEGGRGGSYSPSIHLPVSR